MPYDDAWNWQKDIVREKRTFIERKEESPDTLIVLQHHPVYTLGTGSSVGYLNFDVEDAPYEVYRTERGGEVTYHGPGQVYSSSLLSTHFSMSSFQILKINGLKRNLYLYDTRA